MNSPRRVYLGSKPFFPGLNFTSIGKNGKDIPFEPPPEPDFKLKLDNTDPNLTYVNMTFSARATA